MTTTSVEINVLGPVEVVADGRALSFTRERERVLLALLAARAPDPVPADQLIEDLWGDDPPDGAHTTLRAYVSRLRRTLCAHELDGLIVTRRRGYGLAAEAAEAAEANVLDSARFIALLAQAEQRRRDGDRDGESDTLRAALALWRGLAFEDAASILAIIPFARALEEQRLLALERWAAAELACSRPAELSAALAPICDAHPTRERLWALRMRALYRSGRATEALGAYRELYRRLGDEFGIAPSPELRALELALLRQDPSLAPNREGLALAVPVPLRAPVWGPFVGRRAELDAFAARRALARSGASQLVVISGEPGAGKTRLVSEWAHREHARGSSVLYGRCDRDHSRPYQPYVEALAPYLRTAAGLEAADPVLRTLFPELGSERAGAGLQPGDLELARWRLFDAVTELIVTAAADTPLTLILDDIHWADRSSLQLLRHLARRAGQAPLLMLVTHRPGAQFAGESLAELALDPGFTALELAGLTEAEVAEMAAGSPAASLDGLAAELHRVSDGNPLLVRGTLAQLELAQERGHSNAALAWPAGVSEVIAARLTLLPSDALDVLTVAALLGDEFGLLELQEVEVEAGVLDAVEAALRNRVIVPVAASVERYRFSHDLLRSGLIDRLSAPRKARLHERIGDALERLPNIDGQWLIALAGHFAAAARPGHVDRAGDHALRAGSYALEQLAFEQASGIAERGLRCLALEQRGPSAPRCELELLHARARLLARDIPGCKEAAARAGDDARALGGSSQLARAAIVGSHLNTFGQPSQTTRRLCEDALAATGSHDPGATAQILAGFADYVASSEGDAPGAEDLSRRAVQTARSCQNAHAIARALFVHGELLAWSPRVEERLALATELHALALDRRDPQAEANAHQMSALARLEAGDVAGFDEDIARIEMLRDRIDYWYTDMFALLWRGMRALLDDRLR